MKEAEGRSVADGVVALIGERQALVLLDNLEQLVDAAPDVGRLVAKCPDFAWSSRAGHPFGSPPSTSSRSRPSGLTPLSQLFASAQPHPERLELTAENSEAVEHLCRRLDGMPLALELAAARLRSPVA